MTIIEILFIIAISNLITEQKIGRDIVNYIIPYENYNKFSKLKRFIHSILTCPACNSVYVTIIYELFNLKTLNLQFIMWPLIIMLIIDTKNRLLK